MNALLSRLSMLRHRITSVAALKDYQSIFETLKRNLHIQTPKSSQTSDAPIFVVGMPRSGTTLVERILSHHSKVASGGELQDLGIAVKQVTGTNSQLVLDTPTIEKAYHSNLSLLVNVTSHEPRFCEKGTNVW